MKCRGSGIPEKAKAPQGTSGSGLNSTRPGRVYLRVTVGIRRYFILRKAYLSRFLHSFSVSQTKPKSWKHSDEPKYCLQLRIQNRLFFYSGLYFPNINYEEGS